MVLLSGHMKQHSVVHKRTIAAYVIGYPVTADYTQKNPYFKFLKGLMMLNLLFSFENSLARNIINLIIDAI